MPGIMEKIYNQLQDLNERIDHLSAGRGVPQLIDGKAALTTPEAAELLGMTSETLNEEAKRGEWPHFKKGSHYMYPVRPLLERMEEKGRENMEQRKKVSQGKLSSISL